MGPSLYPIQRSMLHIGLLVKERTSTRKVFLILIVSTNTKIGLVLSSMCSMIIDLSHKYHLNSKVPNSRMRHIWYYLSLTHSRVDKSLFYYQISF